MSARDDRFALLPFELFRDRRLGKHDLAIVAVIAAMSNNGSEVNAGNRYLAELLGLTVRSVSRSIQRLADHGIVEVCQVVGRRRSVAVSAEIKAMYSRIMSPPKNAPASKARKALPTDVEVDWFDDYLRRFKEEHG